MASEPTSSRKDGSFITTTVAGVEPEVGTGSYELQQVITQVWKLNYSYGGETSRQDPPTDNVYFTIAF